MDFGERAHPPDLLAEEGYAYTLNWCHDDQLRRALEHIARARDRGGLWVTTPGAICRHVEALGLPATPG